MLASYACCPKNSRGRLYPEKEDLHRHQFQRDRDRVIHCGAFRKLEHKTQVFINSEHDYYRTRLTHSLEVAQVARTLARRLNLEENLAEAIALAHDIGHPPFGHAGEDALRELTKKLGNQGTLFNHNIQSLRVLTVLEQRYAEFDGLNLTWEMLEGIAKHNGPVKGPNADSRQEVNTVLLEYNNRHDLDLYTFASAEAQVASLADDIAYNSHDIDDGIRAKMFSVGDLIPLPVVGNIILQVNRHYPNITPSRLIHETLRRLVSAMIDDVVNEFHKEIEVTKVKCVDDIRQLGHPIVHFSPQISEANIALKSFLYQNFYRHHTINCMKRKGTKLLHDLFHLFHQHPDCLPEEWQAKLSEGDNSNRIITICDYIAGMTDRYAIAKHHELFDF